MLSPRYIAKCAIRTLCHVHGDAQDLRKSPRNTPYDPKGQVCAKSLSVLYESSRPCRLSVLSLCPRQLPRLRVLPCDIDRMIYMQQEPRLAVEETESEKVVENERCERTQRQVDRGEMHRPLGHNHLGAQSRVSVHVLDVVGDGWVGVMEEGAVQLVSLSFEFHIFVNKSILESSRAATKKTKLPVRPVAAVLDPPAEEMVLARNPQARDRRGNECDGSIRNSVLRRFSSSSQNVVANFFRESWLNFLVCIQAQNPIAACFVQRRVLLRGETPPFLHENFRAVRFRNLDGAIGRS